MYGFDGIKSKYLQKSHDSDENVHEGERSFLTSFYRTQNANWSQSKSSSKAEKIFLENTGFSPEKADALQKKHLSTEKRHIKSYMNQDINIHKMLG